MGPIDPRLERVVDRMFQRCFTDHEYKQAIGIALETRRMDILQRAITESVSLSTSLSLSLSLCPMSGHAPSPAPTGQKSRDVVIHSTYLPQPAEQPKAAEQGTFIFCCTHYLTSPRPCSAPPHPPQVLTLLAELHMSAEKPDYIAVTQSYIFLDQPQSMADILVKLAKGPEVCACALWVGWAAATAVCWTPPPGDCRRIPL